MKNRYKRQVTFTLSPETINILNDKVNKSAYVDNLILKEHYSLSKDTTTENNVDTYKVQL